MKFESLDYEEVHDIVDRNKFLAWDGYTVTTWRRDPRGYSDKRGQFRNGEWGFLFSYPCGPDGKWNIPESYVRHARNR
jgi:hypothetical protein